MVSSTALTLEADKEFVTSGNYVNFSAQVKFSGINTKIYQFCEICQIQTIGVTNNWTECVLE